jgi:hypothetical protein
VERADYSSCYVICNNCMARGPTSCNVNDEDCAAEDAGMEPGEHAARRLWNTRPAQSEIVRLTTVLQGVREPSPVSTMMDYATLDTPIGNTTKGGPKQSLTLRQWLEADNRTPQFRARLMALCIIERQQAALAALKGNQP